MKAPLRVLIGAAVCAFALGCSYAGRIAEAKSDTRQKSKTPRAIITSGGRSARPEWRLGAPVTHGNLTVFPVLSDQSASTEEFITLDEGFRSGKVTVTEMGADGRSRAINPNQQSGDHAEVNRLMVTNNSGKTLVLIAGEIVVGGKQDRIVGHDCLVTSSAKPVPLDVFCVEHGRWHEGASFGHSQRAGDRDVVDVSRGFGSAHTVMATPKVREKAQAKKDQSGVWAEVSKAEIANGVSSSTGTLNRVFEDRQVLAKLDAFDKELNTKLIGKNIVGAVVAIGGEIVSADVFANSPLFQAYWPKLLKSYALQAVSSPKTTSSAIDKAAAEAFLARADAKSASNGKEGIYKLTEHNAPGDASFELESDATNRKLIHFNRVNTK